MKKTLKIIIIILILIPIFLLSVLLFSKGNIKYSETIEIEKPIDMERTLVENIHGEYKINESAGGTRSYQKGGAKKPTPRAAFIQNLMETGKDDITQINLTDIYDMTPDRLTTIFKPGQQYKNCYFTIKIVQFKLLVGLHYLGKWLRGRKCNFTAKMCILRGFN